MYITLSRAKGYCERNDCGSPSFDLRRARNRHRKTKSQTRARPSVAKSNVPLRGRRFVEDRLIYAGTRAYLRHLGRLPPEKFIRGQTTAIGMDDAQMRLEAKRSAQWTIIQKRQSLPGCNGLRHCFSAGRSGGGRRLELQAWRCWFVCFIRRRIGVAGTRGREARPGLRRKAW